MPIDTRTKRGVDDVWRTVAKAAGVTRHGSGETAEQSMMVALRALLQELQATGREADLWP